MRVAIVNPIIYTSETPEIIKVKSIKDTMIYDLCLGFKAAGHDVTLIAAEDYRPTEQEDYPFDVEWVKCVCKGIFRPNVLPYCPKIKNTVKKGKFDLIITSEVFSLNSLSLATHFGKKTIVWHELAKHNNIMHKIPSKVWYGAVARLFFGSCLVVPRSEQAKEFIAQYCKNVSGVIIDHGVNLDKFTLCDKDKNVFAVCSQLIPRKQVDKTIAIFAKYVNKYNQNARLYIMGDGVSKNNLTALVKSLNMQNNIIFTGKLPHSEMVRYLAQSQAMLVSTRKDNNIVSIAESIACGTPVITNLVPYNSSLIKSAELGIADDNWSEDDIDTICNDGKYSKNCAQYRSTMSVKAKAQLFTQLLLNKSGD